MNPAMTDKVAASFPFWSTILQIVGWLMVAAGLGAWTASKRQSIKTRALVLALGGFLLVILMLMHDFAGLNGPSN